MEELSRLGIDYVQGFGVARPQRLPDALADWQARHPLPHSPSPSLLPQPPQPPLLLTDQPG